MAQENTGFPEGRKLESKINTVSGIGGQVSERASGIVSSAANKTNDAISGIGDQISSFADNLRERSDTNTSIGSATRAVADKLSSSGEYLSSQKLDGIAKDIGGVVKRYPVYSMIAGLGMGLLVGMRMSAKRN